LGWRPERHPGEVWGGAALPRCTESRISNGFSRATTSRQLARHRICEEQRRPCGRASPAPHSACTAAPLRNPVKK
jgi:hypothetical protein